MATFGLFHRCRINHCARVNTQRWTKQFTSIYHRASMNFTIGTDEQCTGVVVQWKSVANFFFSCWLVMVMAMAMTHKPRFVAIINQQTDWKSLWMPIDRARSINRRRQKSGQRFSSLRFVVVVVVSAWECGKINGRTPIRLQLTNRFRFVFQRCSVLLNSMLSNCRPNIWFRLFCNQFQFHLRVVLDFPFFFFFSSPYFASSTGGNAYRPASCVLSNNQRHNKIIVVDFCCCCWF